MSGWIKLHRQIKDNPFCYRNMERLGFWSYLLLEANHERAEFYIGQQKVACEPGQIVAGRKALSLATGLSESKVERFLKLLEVEGQIEQQTNSRFRVIKLKNWNQYQKIEQQMNSSRTADEQPVDTNKKEKKEKNVRNPLGVMDAAASPPVEEVLDPMEDELRQVIPFVSKILGHPKVFTPDSLRCWKARRGNRSPRELAQAFANLSNEPDQWKIKNNGWRPLSWWLEKDSRIEEMLNCHLKVPINRKPLHVAG